MTKRDTGQEATSLLWILNLPFPGLGNLVTSGMKSFSRPLLIFAVLVFVIVPGWFLKWAILYLLFSIAGVAQISRDAKGGRLTRGNRGNAALLDASSGQEDNNYASDRFERRVRDIEDKFASQEARQENTAKESAAVPAKAGYVRPAVKYTEAAAPFVQPAVTYTEGSFADIPDNSPSQTSTSTSASAASANNAQPSIGTGQLAYQFNAPLAPAPCLSGGSADSPVAAAASTSAAPTSFNQAGNQPGINYSDIGSFPASNAYAYSVGSAPQTQDSSPAAGRQQKPESKTCSNCGAPRDHSFSFCLNCARMFDQN